MADETGKETARGKFIVFEGIDGAGKTTQIGLLADRLRREGRRVQITAEPTASAVGGLLRDALEGLTPRTPCEMATLFAADRVGHNVHPTSGIEKMLAEGTDVICDRYYYSSLAYQGSQIDFAWVKSLNLDCPEIRHPDLCVFLDLTPEASLRRIRRNRASTEIFENEETLERVRDQFRTAFEAAGDPVRVVNADDTPDAVAEAVYEAVSSIL